MAKRFATVKFTKEEAESLLQLAQEAEFDTFDSNDDPAAAAAAANNAMTKLQRAIAEFEE